MIKTGMFYFVWICYINFFFCLNLFGQTDSLIHYDNYGISFTYMDNIKLSEYLLPNIVIIQLTKDENTDDYGFPANRLTITKLLNDSLISDFEQEFHNEYENAIKAKDKNVRLAKENEKNLLSYLKSFDQNLSYKNIEDEINISEINTIEIGYKKYKSMFYAISVSPIMSLFVVGDNNSLLYINTKEYLIDMENCLYHIQTYYIGKELYDNFFDSVMLTIEIDGKSGK